MIKLKHLFMLSPYIGVITGMYVFKNAFAAIFIYHAGIAAAVCLFHGEISFNTLFKFNNPRLLIFASAVCLLSGLSVVVLWNFIKLPGINLPVIMEQFKLSGINKWIFLLYFSTVHPLIEELYWRFLADFRGRYISVGDIIFAAYHIPVLIFFLNASFVLLCFAVLVAAARIWRYLKQDLNENLTVFISHAFADFSIMLAVFALY
ncbi:MAG: hypothetical protein JW982_16815 [Spirochaetes bacterium]|nr:hypothetical protein [Spirochaetota bacterium]